MNMDDKRFWDERKAQPARERAEAKTLAADLEATAARRLVEWTRDVTIARRAEWNARVRAGEFNVRGQFFPAKAAAAQTVQGWNIENLKAAIARHGL